MATLTYGQFDTGNVHPPNTPQNDPAKPTPPRDTHRRGYQACEPCRSRKVKCDLGGVDSPHEPPCARCLREQKTCVFAPTRKKRKSHGEEDSDGDKISRPVKRPANNDNNDPFHNPNTPGAHSSYSSQAHTPHGYNPLPQHPPMNPSMNPNMHHGLPHMQNPSYQQQTNALLAQAPTESKPRPAQAPQQQYQVPNRASNLARAPGTNEHVLNKDATTMLEPAIASSSDALQLLSNTAATLEQAKQNANSHMRSMSGGSHRRAPSGFGASGPAGTQEVELSPQLQQEYGAALRVWSRMRLVKDGCLTAWEAVAYVDYFYEHLAPMTPVVIDHYRPYHMHARLIVDEPVLALTLMTISSRHMKLQGGGATSRGYEIHGVLWSKLQRMINRLYWGQEQFGGGFAGDGVKTHETETGHINWQGSLRTLGTIEALLLLTDWHPRALHFAPLDNETRLLDDDALDPVSHASGPEKSPVAFSDWLEPAWRSDRMSWMLLGTAVALSFEVGVFDNKHYTCQDAHHPGSECARKQRVRRMVLVYMSQTSGRLGLKPTLSLPEWKVDQVYEQTARTQRKGPLDAVDVMQECWMGIAGLMWQANQEIFPSKKFTSDLTSSGNYVGIIEKFQPMLATWKNHFDAVNARFEPVMQHLLSMEYEYARLFINSLGFQKVVESWVKINNDANSLGNSNHAGSGGVPFSLLLEILKPNKKYIDEVSDAARNMLKTVMDGLVPGGHLVYASVRSYFRILPALIFTLKRFGFGASEADVRESFALLDGITKNLRECVVDDVHLSSRMAEGVRGLSSSLRKKFIRIQAPNGASTDNSRAPTPPHSNGGTSNTVGNERMGMNQQQNIPPQYGWMPGQNNMNHPAAPFGGPHGSHGGYDPLAGIQRQNLADVTNVPFMPPSNYPEYMTAPGPETSSDMPFPTEDIHGQQNQQNQQSAGDWITLPLDSFMTGAQAPVHQGFGGMGPAVGGRDMLELLTDVGGNWVQRPGPGPGPGQGGNAGQGGFHGQ